MKGKTERGCHVASLPAVCRSMLDAGLAAAVAEVCSGVRSAVKPVRGSCHASLRTLGCHTSSSRMSKGKSPKRRGFLGSRALEKVLPMRIPCRL